MAFTAANLTAVENALIALASGTRKVRLSMGDKSIEYSNTDIPVLTALRDKIAAEVSTVPRCILFSTSKGL
ncbi:MAG: hypothetical protein M0P74_00755 [Syntrophales bacterium]|jgi:hypothetical protein|nr:hypothetical protein [Syntrophales bacterium]